MEKEGYIYGFKGFNKLLECKNFKFEVGNTYKIDEVIKICYKGFHYCEKLSSVNSYYSLTNSYSSNRVCVVKAKIPNLDEINGSYKEGNKSVTNEITIIRELTSEEIKIILQEESKNSLSDDEIFRIKELKIIQKTYPDFSIGGSVGLYLQGFDIKRDKPVTDFDFTIPYFKRLDLRDFNGDTNVTEVDQMDDAKNSGNDFDYTNAIVINGEFILMDMKIDPKYRYNIVDYNGFKFKVCPWEVIIQAKMNYLNSSTGPKHKADLLEMFGNPKNIIKEEKIKSTSERILEEIIDKELKEEL